MAGLVLIQILDQVLEDLRESEYSGCPDAEALVHLMVELLIRDRVKLLKDRDAIRPLNFWPQSYNTLSKGSCGQLREGRLGNVSWQSKAST